MSHGKQQSDAEIESFHSALKAARLKGGEASRNANKISGQVDPFDRPDIMVCACNRTLIGFEHFRVDQCIARGKKKESRTAELSSKIESTGLMYREDALANDLPDDAYREFGDLISESIKIYSNSCIDDVAESLNAGLFGEEKRGHVAKLEAYRHNLRSCSSAENIQLGFLIEFHTDFEGWFLNEGNSARAIRHGEMPISCGAYDLLQRASDHIDWLVLSFCPLFTSEPIDAAVVDCRNGMFRSSMERQHLFRTPYLGLGKSEPFRKQETNGSVEFSFDGDDARYLIENTSEPINALAMFENAIEETVRAVSFRRSGRPYAATLPVQLCCELTEDSLKAINTPISTYEVCKAIFEMDPSKKSEKLELFQARWGLTGPNP